MRPIRLLAAVGVLCWCAAAYAGPPVQINEIRIDDSSTGLPSDPQEYFELSGMPSASLAGLTYVVIGDGTGASGVIEAAIDLGAHSLDANGFFVAAESTFTLGVANLTIDLPFENSDNVTHLLVSGFTGAVGNDLDVDNNCGLDGPVPWAAVLDLIALIEAQNSPGGPPAATECHYGPPTIGPEFIPGPAVPGHILRCFSDNLWLFGVFLEGTDDTPGAVNSGVGVQDCVCGLPEFGNCFTAHADPYCNDAECCDEVCIIDATCCSDSWDAACAALAGTECTVPGPAPAVTLNEIRTGNPGDDIDEYFELKAALGTDLLGVAYIVIGDDGANNGVIEEVAILSGNLVGVSGLFVGAESTFTLGAASFVGDFNFEDGDNVTHLLVFNFTGSDNQDLDPDDDGDLDILPWGELMDSVAIVGNNTPGVDGDHIYSATTVGPDGTFTPGQVYLCTAPPAATWKIGPFDPADPGETDTPGAANTSCAFVAPCGSSLAGECFEAHATPNCDNADCCTTVCMTSPSCCSTAWTQACADQAQVQCLACGNLATGSCFELGTTPYCIEADCCTTVCNLDPTCCTSDWDQGCVDLANANCEPAEIMITEIVDGPLVGGQPKWVEITNCGIDAEDLSIYSIGNFNNASTEMNSPATGLTGLLNPGESFIFSYSADTDTVFMTVYGFAPDQFAGGGFINGNDAIALFLGPATGDGSDATIVDVYGEIGVEGVGAVWEYTDSYASRNAGSTPTAIFDPDQWTFAGPDALEDPNEDDMIETMNLQNNTNPGEYDCELGPVCPTCVGDFAAAFGVVNAADLAFLLGNWGMGCNLGAGCCMDINGIGGVNAADLALLLGNWGACQ